MYVGRQHTVTVDARVAFVDEGGGADRKTSDGA
jgi:hypothetical protein